MTEMTSLAKQLQRLAVPHTQTILGEDKKKASLLFDPKEAASIDRETFYALGLNGLEELETIDEDFSEFETSLFGDSSLMFERSVQTKEINAKLDKTIQKFLIHVSPYCLLKPAHKAIEWLIHRFHIHFYNTDVLLLCFLPYHESKIFARVLQLVKFDSKTASKWDFLEPLQKSGVHLSRMTLVNHCATDVAFLSFVCDMVPTAVKESVLTEKGEKPKCRVLFSFYATTVIGVLDTASESEVIVSTLLPHVTTGMMSGVHEYKAASYMILAQLLHKMKLKADLVKSLQRVLAKSMIQDLLGEAMSCMLLMFQTQDVTNYGITKKTFKYICQHHGIVDVLCHLYTQFEAAQFLTYFLDLLIPAAFKHAVGIATSGESSASESSGGLKEYMSMLHRLLSTLSLPDDTAEMAAYKFLQVFIRHGSKHLDNDVDDRIKESLQGIVRQLEGKHSAAVDKAISKILTECKNSAEKDLVNEFLNLYVLSVPHQLITDSETSLVLSLNHRLPTVRKKAVATLIQNRAELEEDGFLKDSLTLRLQDEDPCVVQAVLAIGQELWSVIDDDLQTCKLLLKPIFEYLNNQQGSAVNERRQSACLAAEILGNYCGDNTMEIFTRCLPCLFLTQKSKESVKIIGMLLDSKLTSKHPVLVEVKKEWTAVSKTVTKESADIGMMDTSIAQCLAHGLCHAITQNNLQIVRDWTNIAGKADNARTVCLMLIVLDILVTMNTDSKIRLELCLLQIQLIDNIQRAQMVHSRKVKVQEMNKGWKGIITDDKHLLLAVKNNQVLSTMCQKAVAGVIKVLKVPKQLIQAPVWQLSGDETESDVFLCVSVLLYRFLLAEVSTKVGHIYIVMLQSIQKTCFNNAELYLKFLCLLWTQHANNRVNDLGLTLTLQARSLNLGHAFVKSLEGEDRKRFLQSPTAMSGLLLVLTSEQAQIRRAGVQVIKELYSIAEEESTMFSSLHKRIVRCEEEIESDSMYINQLIGQHFKHTSASETVSKRSKRRKSEGGGQDKDIKQSALMSLLELIINQSTPGYMQYKMLVVFSQLNNKDVLEALLPLMERLLDQSVDDMPEIDSKCLNLLVQRFTLDTSDCLSKASKGLLLFIKTLKLHQEVSENSQTSQMIAVSQVTKELFGAIEDDSQHEVMSTLFDVCVDTKHLLVANLIRKTLKHLSVNGEHIEKELKKCLDIPTAKTVREAKRLKRPDPTPQSVGDTEFDSRIWQRVTVVLEAVQNKKKIQNYYCLVPVCFQLMSSILESDNHVAVEYIKQLILTLMYNICTRLDKLEQDDIIPEQQFNMDLIINCIRSSDNPQTHHHALLLLTAAAKIYPEHLLHNMMSVFTFMGANIMRQDDAYSFLIISKILETVVPALITACEQRKRVPKGITNDPDDIITMVIQVFVDSYPYIPEHRRQLLFNKLMTVTGEEKYLWRTLLLMMKHVVTKGTLKAELTTDSQEVSSDTEFCLSMCSEFTAAVQLLAAREMMNYLLKLPDDKDDDVVKVVRKGQKSQSFGKLHKEDALVFNVAVHTGKQLRYFKYAAINLLVNLFSSIDFIYQITESAEDLSGEFQLVLETALKFVSHITNTANRSHAKPTAKYWRAILHKSHDMLDKFVSLLPDDLFVTVIGGLLSHDLPTIQRKAMDLLNSKLQQQKEMKPAEVEGMLSIVDQLRKLVNHLAAGDVISEENSINCQTAFISLKLLCRHLGNVHKETFCKVLKTTITVFKQPGINHQVASCALLCIAEIVSTLKVNVIAQLPKFMPPLIAVMADRENLFKNELYVISVVTAVNKLVENLSNFLSPYLHDIVTNVCILSTEAMQNDILQKPQVALRLKTIRTTLSTNIPTRVLLPVVTTCYNHLVKSNLMSVSSLMSLFGEHVSHITREDLTSHLSYLQTFFLQCLDIRIDFPALDEEKLSMIESVTIETIITMVMKLSESTFKPFLFKIFDWATTSEELRERILVFYKLAERLAERLRSLFTLFAGHIISHAAKMLDENNNIKREESFFQDDSEEYEKSCQLLEYILDCINKCCMYDTEGFINKERFDLLMQPLVDQLENQQGSEEQSENRSKGSTWFPAIVQLCVAAQDDFYGGLLTIKFVYLQGKKSALVTLDMLHKKLGEDYMPLLPDTIPFLAELMEDESEEVEKKCHEVIREMEKTLGEPLQKYF
ncbi:HEAT repeat-containing protein 1-like [Ruditapes philippinarum]|uniref:HEAT repeat-containing protein 1-like n=1 Tax=Ruditapes philippinarum TaxID=129788 RepID=UPI00295B79BF|nr:HEAT repeat-containing protein 1-like [Ruditapes philippinarum]